MDQTMDRGGDADAEEDDDLLRTIREMVSAEAARPAARAPAHHPSMDEDSHGMAEAAAAAPLPTEKVPLVLGSMVRVDGDDGDPQTPGTAPSPVAASDSAELEAMVAAAVRAEVDAQLGDALALRIRKIVRQELAEFLARARDD